MAETGMTSRRFVRIKGLTERTLLPRCGKVRLGERRVKGETEYPADLTYFRFDDEILARYPNIARLYANQETGAIEPRELDIMFPVEDEATVFPQSLRYYGRSRGLRCIGDGEQAMRFVCSKCKVMDCRCQSQPGAAAPQAVPQAVPQMERVAQKCKCELYEQGKCKDRGSLMFLLPRVTWEGCWQLDTGSFHNIIHINSALRFVRAVLGRVSLVPMKLRRVPVELTHGGKKRKHWLLSLGFDGDADAVRRIRAELPEGPRPGAAMPHYELPEPTLEGDEAPAIEEETTDHTEDTELGAARNVPASEPAKPTPSGDQPSRAAPPLRPADEPVLPISADQEARLKELKKEHMMSFDDWQILLLGYGKKSGKDLTEAQADELIDHLEKKREAAEK